MREVCGICGYAHHNLRLGKDAVLPGARRAFSRDQGCAEVPHGQWYRLAIVALATAGEEQIAERRSIIEREDIGRYFVSIKFAVSDKGQLYAATLGELALDPRDVTIVDDRVVRGVAWGTAHGCRTMWCRNGKYAHEEPTAATGEPT